MGRLGSELSVCVVPNQKAIDAGLKLKQIDSFVWVRVDPGGGRVEQVAVNDGKVPGNGLTEMVCDDDGCGFKSILQSNFFVDNIPPPTEAPSSAPTPVPNVIGPLKTLHDPNMCLDYNFNTGNIYMNPCNGADNQQWDWDPVTGLVRSTGAYSNVCIREDFGAIRGAGCENYPEFSWSFNPYYDNHWMQQLRGDLWANVLISIQATTMSIWAIALLDRISSG